MAGIRLRRTARALVVVWALATLSFFAVRLGPGDAAAVRNAAVPADHALVQARLYGLDRPLFDQYRAWLGGLATGELGWSFDYRRPVTEVLAQVSGPTIVLTSMALALQYAIALVLAPAVAGSRRALRRVDSTMAVLHAVPTFWLALLALALFARQWRIFPEHGAAPLGAASMPPWLEGVQVLWHALLPASVLGFAGSAGIFRLTAPRVAAALRSPRADAARARGVGELRLRFRHALRPSLGPAVQRLGLDLPTLVAGALLVEVVFSRPGLGRAVHRAFLARDLPLLAAGSFAAGLLVVAGSWLADELARRLDPRIGAA